MTAPSRPALPGDSRRPAEMTHDDMRWLAWHEASAHALFGREVRDLGDAWMLYDETDREPFWNRIAGVSWPDQPGAFDRRLTEVLALFAGLDRIPHVWPTAGFDRPLDLAARLVANGFRDEGGGMLMVLDPDRAPPRHDAAPAAGLTVERLHGVSGQAALDAAKAVGAVLLSAFEVEPGRRVAIELEVVEGLANDAYHAILLRVDGRPAAVARRTSFAGASYLSSIGTDAAFRGRGLGRLVTELAVEDAIAAGSRWTYLGVFEENRVARTLYESIGFEAIGGPAPDLVLRP